MASVPPIDEAAQGSPGVSAKRFEEIELRLIDAEAKAKENRNRETDQRYFFRFVAVGCACLLILGMATMLWHLAHWTVGNPNNAPASFIVAIFVAPILSMTTLALALLVAAFRGYKESDEATGATLASQGMKATGILQ
jgi:hypothetical protein